MNYIVLDLEWNQAADLKTKIENQLLFEIIEVGAVKLNEYKQQTDSFHELIKPQVFHKMNQITGELVHLSIDQLDNCRSFKEVVVILLSGVARIISFVHGEILTFWNYRGIWTIIICPN